MKVTYSDVGHEEFVDSYVIEFSEMVQNFLLLWVDDLKSTDNNTEIFNFDIVNNFHAKNKKFDSGKFKYIMSDNLYTYIRIIETCMINAVDTLSKISNINIKNFIISYVENLNDKLDYIENELEKKLQQIWLIQRQWRESISNPTYAICRRRLMREYTELI